jgi:hypothetical protein
MLFERPRSGQDFRAQLPYMYFQELEVCQNALRDALVKLNAAKDEKMRILQDIDDSRAVVEHRDEAIRSCSCLSVCLSVFLSVCLSVVEERE